MVELNEHEAEEHSSIKLDQVGKKEKAHTRGVVGLYAYENGPDNFGLISVAHDSLKLWQVDISENGTVSFSMKHEVSKWRCGVQSVDASSDGKCVSIIGLDSILYEVLINDEGPTVLAKDLGYMETWHIRIAKDKTSYITTSFSGFLSEINLSGEFSRREPVNHVKQISVLAYSNNNRLLAIGNLEGVVRTYDVSTLKNINSYEIHAMKIRAIVFLPEDDKFLTASDDKTLKLFSLTSNSSLNTYCGCSSPIACVSLELEKYNGRLFATGCLNGDILLWALTEYVPIVSLSNQHEGGVWSLVFSPGGEFLFSTGEDKQISCFAVPNIKMPTISNTDGDSRLHNDTEMDYDRLKNNGHNYDHMEDDSNDLRKPAIQDNEDPKLLEDLAMEELHETDNFSIHKIESAEQDTYAMETNEMDD